MILSTVILSQRCLMWFSMGCRGTNCFPSPWSSPLTSRKSLLRFPEHFIRIILDQPWCLQGCFFHIFSFLSLTAAAQKFLPFLKYIITEALPASVLGSALASDGSIGAVWNQLHLTWRQLLVSSCRGHPWSLPTIKTLPCKTNTDK